VIDFAIVTGGGSGIGYATAQSLTESGARVMVWGREPGKLKAAVSSGAAAEYRVVDVADSQAVAEAFDAVSHDLIGECAVVHSAGVWTPGDLLDLSPETIASHVGIVTLGTGYVLRSAIGHMLANQAQGKVVDIIAASAKPGFEETALNSMAKRALDGLHEGLLRELRGGPISLTGIYPDSVAVMGGPEVASGDAMSYEDVAGAVMYALSARPSIRVAEIVLTAPNTGR
jgi:3-oxoacyl-[acyl-carrier protein] reductase